MNISYVWLYVRDTGSSLRWYRDVLGLPVVETFPHGALFQAGDVLLGVHREEGERNAHPGSTIIIWNVVDIESTYKRLSKNGVVFEGQIRDEPYGRIVEFRDPDGYVFEIVQKSLDSRGP